MAYRMIICCGHACEYVFICALFYRVYNCMKIIFSEYAYHYVVVYFLFWGYIVAVIFCEYDKHF